ncbi:reverse transcriptase domain-containing protein [Tanacetum coccineum]
MSTHEQITNNPTSAVRNTGGRNGPQGLEEPMSDEILREMCDKNYHQLLPLIAEKMQKEKEQKDKLNAVKARLIYGEESGIKIRSREESHYSESKTPTARTEPRRRHGDRYSRSPSPHASVFKRLKKNRSPSPQPRPRKEGGVFNRLGRKEPATSARSDSRRRSPQAKRTEVETRRRQQKRTPSRTTSQYSESEDSEGGHWKSKSRRQRSNTYEDDLSQPWTCEERNPFTPRIRHFSLPRTRMPSHVKTYDGSGRSERSPKVISIGRKNRSYEDLRTAFRENYLQQTKHIKDPVEIHHIKQRDGESTEDFMERYKAEVLDVEGAPECMRISGFMHGITHPGLIKRLYERIPRSVDEMYRMTTSFLQGEVAALSHGRRKASSSWKPSEGGDKPTFKKGFKNKQRPDRKEKEDMGTERNKALQEEWKLSGAGIMNMTDLANVCGFKDLTTHAPTIRYPLPEIDEGGVPLWDGNVLRYKSKHHRVVKACPIKQTRSLSCHLEMHQGRVRAKWGKFLKEKSIHEKEILDIVEEEGNTWMTPIREYLTKEILPEDKKKARADTTGRQMTFGCTGTLIRRQGLSIHRPL